MQTGYDINHLVREAQTRWLKPAEVLFILQNYEEHQLTHQIPQKPSSGSLYLFNKRVLKFFRKDGHSWRKRKDQRTIAEAHERLKVGNAEAINCYYAHGEPNPNFQRRSYWMLDPAYEHIVLVHYRHTEEGRQNTTLTSQLSPLSSSISSQSPNSFATQQQDSSVVINESYGPYQNTSSPGSFEISSDGVKSRGMNQSDITQRIEEINSSSDPDLGQALRRIEQQLSLNDDVVEEISAFYIENNDSNYLGNVLNDYELSARRPDASDSNLLQPHPGDNVKHNQSLSDNEVNNWKEMLGNSKNFPNVEAQAYEAQLNENGLLLHSSPNELAKNQEIYNWPNFGRQDAQKYSMIIPQEVESIRYPAYSSRMNTSGINQDCYQTAFDQDWTGISLEENLILKQKFTIREISPQWCYAYEAAKVIIIGSFHCEPSESTWACMFGDIEVPVQIIQEGVICCHAPAHLPGKVKLCITSGNKESCSEIREFEYRVKPRVSTYRNILEKEVIKSPEELLLLVRLVQMLLSDPSDQKGDGSESRIGLLGNGKSKMSEDTWNQIIDAILGGTSTSFSTMEWLMQELLKDKLELWLSSKLQKNNQLTCSLSKKEQGVIHIIAGLGFEWALQPILSSGVNVNFRDINGWTALHWAARFGREKMVAALIASGASAGAVTDPNSQDPTGKTPASVAATNGHKGLAGYLSEMSLTGHLSSLTMEESHLSKGSAAVEAERTVNSISNTSFYTDEDRDSLRDSLAAVRNATQAAARIQSAFRAHSFLKRQQREAAVAIDGDEYAILSNDIPGISAASKLAFRNTRDYNSAALSIQKKYRGWKGRKDFLSFRQKVVKIQAHVRGYQVRKNYKFCWAVGVLEKVILRWRRGGIGLRGFRQDLEFIDKSEDEDILKVFRKQKVDAAIDESVSRVLSMVESPEARHQYHRILEKYRQAKAELESAGPESLKNHPTYGALLNCYCKDLMTEKAEALMDKMKELNLELSSMPYNSLMTLYTKTEQAEKVPAIIQEMKSCDIMPDCYTYNVWMRALAAMNEISGVERVIDEMKRDGRVAGDWTTYSNLASIYADAGLFDKAEKALKELEKLNTRREFSAYQFLITLYGRTGNLLEVYRIWRSLRLSFPKTPNISYLNMIQVLVKLNDLPGAEKCYREWASGCSTYDIRIANALIGAYLKEGSLEKVEALKALAKRRGAKPNAKTWELYLDYYLKNREIKSAVDCIENAISTGRGDGGKWIPSPALIGELMRCFEQNKDVEGAERFLEVLKKSKDDLGSEVLESLIRIYAAAGKTSPVMRRWIKMENAELSEEGKKLLDVVCKE